MKIKKRNKLFLLAFILNLTFCQEYKIQFAHIPTGQGMGQNDSIGVMNSIGGVLLRDISSDSFAVGTGFLKTTQSIFSEPPVISNFTFPDIIVKSASSNTILATLYDLNGIKNVDLYLQMGGSTNDTIIPMSNSEDRDYYVLIDDTLIGVQNFRARIVGTDNMGYVASSEYKTSEIQFSNGELSMANDNSQYPDGIPTGRWRLMSWPGQPANTSLARSKLKDGHVFYSWDIEKNDFIIADIIELGHSYWFRHKYENPVVFSEDSSTAMPLENYTIKLEQGWNMVGNPFSFPVQYVKDSNIDDPITYGNSDKDGWSGPQTELQPWNGYAVYASAESDLVLIPFQEQDSSAQRVANIDGWYLNLKAESPNFFHHAAQIGRHENASNGQDLYDTPQLPDMNETISLLMDLNGNSSFRYSKDIRDLDELNGVWNLRLDGNSDERSMILSGVLKGSIPEGLRIAIVDIQERKVSHEILNQGLVIKKDPNLDYDLKLVAGDIEYVATMTEEILNNIPSVYSLSQNYPNPFNPITKMNYALPKRSRVIISVYNVLGQEVTTLLNKEQDYGYHTVTWNGTDRIGKQVASGVYFARLTTKNFGQTKKMLMLK
ncbi:MAG: T9SS type A sorting domain-containing protein [Candidatus Marinimicrobia bacterium]|nr:T9SS type A sorting domain-containing protein [Candidatus Neomarinimicrobiota bacterium]